jgi:putative ABC transport system substrate-binding protein
MAYSMLGSWCVRRAPWWPAGRDCPRLGDHRYPFASRGATDGTRSNEAARVSLAPHLPAIYAFAVFTKTGGLLSYGIDQVEIYRRAASYVDRILKGDKPGELPVQAPTKFELIVNLETAKALGLEVP